MKPEQIYQELIVISEKFDISVSEQNFRKTGISVKSGYCIVNDEKRFIIDKHLNIHRKIEALAEFVDTLPHETIYIVPAVRDVLARYGAKNHPIHHESREQAEGGGSSIPILEPE